MTNSIKSFFRVSALLLMFTATVALADEAEIHKGHSPRPDESSPELSRIKSLAGRWKSTTSMFGKENEEVFTEYSITAGGSAVLERIFPDTPNEMVSVYYDDDKGKLAMTHYCLMRNRPQFTLVKSEDDEIKLDVTSVGGLKSKDDPSMGAITIKFEDKDRFTTTCESRSDAKDKQAPMTMQYTRVDK